MEDDVVVTVTAAVVAVCAVASPITEFTVSAIGINVAAAVAVAAAVVFELSQYYKREKRRNS